MAVPTFHITDADSGYKGTNAFAYNTPGTLLMDADAWLVTDSSTLLFFAALTATINGKVTASNFSGGGGAGIYVHIFTGRSTITIGTTGEVTGYNQGILSDTNHATDIVNKGRIVAVGPSGLAIAETVVAGNYSINNSGSIVLTFHGIDLNGGGSGSPGGIHTIINSGIIDAPVAIFGGVFFITEKVTNSGTIDGDVLLGAGNDVFTDFIKIKKHGKVVTKHGTVDGIIDLGDDNDAFNGGNNAEMVKDGQGADTYKLSGGNDTLLAAHDTGLDGVDTIDGGTGRDTYDASAYDSASTLLINLDKIAHRGDNNVIYGNAAANHLVAGSGGFISEQLFGFGGNDVLETDARGSQLFGGDGNDTLIGGSAGCIFDGGSGNDILTAGIGSSDMYGGAGADILTGGDNQGTGIKQHLFRYKALSDSGVTAATRDTITKFAPGGTLATGGDFIDLSAIDAIPATKGIDDDFNFIGANPWGHLAGELRFVWTASQTIVEADVNGDAKADFSIALDGHHTLAATDFIL